MKSITTALFIALVSTALASSAMADAACPQFMPRPFSAIETRIDLGMGKVIQAKDIDCSKIGVGARVVSGIQQMLGRELPVPASITFRMVDQFDNAFFNPEDLSLNVPFQLVLNNYSKNPVYSVAIWAHEFGHAVFDKTLLEAAPKWRSYIQRRRATGAMTSAEILDTLIAGYHEYFADVVAVLYTGKGDAVARGLYMTGFMTNPEGKPSECPNRDPKCRPRSSSKDRAREMASERDFTDRSNQLGHWRSVDPRDSHNLLAPARYHIWKYYLSNPLIMHEKDRLAGVTVDAVMADLNRRMARLAAQPGGITIDNLKREMGDVQRINAEFIDTIDATFTKAFRL